MNEVAEQKIEGGKAAFTVAEFGAAFGMEVADLCRDRFWSVEDTQGWAANAHPRQRCRRMGQVAPTGEGGRMTDLPVGGTTGLCHETSSAIDEAARWLATTPRHQRPRPVVIELQQRFGLGAVDACAAIREADLIIRARAA